MTLLDTCAIIWDALDPDQLTAKAKKTIEQAQGELMICDISIWEISMLIKRKRIVIDDTASAFINLLLQSRNFHVQGITPEIAELSVNFSQEINNDPADRLIAATSILKNAPIITADQNLRDTALLSTIW
ncbi:MAG: type II toxin-antitoxin system VapC family toxin [Nitrospirota bacterium]|nr:type II toxin-antitoxin system VapC family toxin [Nitrospirota bacterium]